VPCLGARFSAYEPAIRRLPRRRPLVDADVLKPRFRLEHDGRLEVYYAPVDWLRPTARIAVVGITPGKDTMRTAYQTAADGLAAGATTAQVLREVKSAAPFSGFRRRLIEWLEYLGVHRHLGLATGSALWTPEGQRYMHSTSAVRYPVLKDGKNYSGRNPDLVRQSILRRYVLDVLAPELAMIPDALVIPLGTAVATATDLLVERGLVDAHRCLSGFPHPSGRNVSGTREWANNKTKLRRTVASWFRRHSTQE
jgi:hypothetical protein